MLSSTFLVALCFCLCLLLSLSPPSTAQPPVSHTPDRYFRGWQCSAFAASRNPATPQLVYLVDASRHVLLLDSRDGRVVQNASYWELDLYLNAIAVDSRGYVHLVATDYASVYQLLVLDEQLRSVKNVSLSELQPRSTGPDRLQLAVDSGNAVYLFESLAKQPSDGRVWVLSPREWRQQATWLAPVERTAANDSVSLTYVMAVDRSALSLTLLLTPPHVAALAEQRSLTPFHRLAVCVRVDVGTTISTSSRRTASTSCS